MSASPSQAFRPISAQSASRLSPAAPRSAAPPWVAALDGVLLALFLGGAAPLLLGTSLAETSVAQTLVLLCLGAFPILAARLTTRQTALFGLRGLVHALGVILWFFAMTRIPLAEVTAMGYLTPVLVTLGAALILGEGFALRRLLAIVAAFSGALIVLRPGLREIDLGHLTMLGNAVFFASSYLIAKKLSGEVSATVIVGMLSVTVPLGLLPFALAVWVHPTLEQLGWFFLTAIFATAGHYTMTFAFAAAPMTVT